MRDLTGRTYTSRKGKYRGQTITVIGLDPLWPDGDRWLVQAERGYRWSVSGENLRRTLDEQKER